MKLGFFLVLAALLALALAKKYDLSQKEEDLYAEYIQDNPTIVTKFASFDSARIATAKNALFRVFKKNLATIKKLNSLGAEAGVKYNLGRFAHMTGDQFRSWIAQSGIDPQEAPSTGLKSYKLAKKSLKRDVEQVPATFSWKTNGKVTAVRNQGDCGSCWAFATAANIESVYLIAGKGKLDLSEQELVDCERTRSMGCNGGSPSGALTYVYQKGIVTEKAYPYKMYTKKCAVSKTAARKRISNFYSVPTNSADYMDALANYAPVVAYVDADAWQFYSSGVLTAAKCSSNLNHAVLLTGYGAAGKSKWWEIKNSWGTSWGEAGYIRLERSTRNTCGIYTNEPHFAEI